MLFTKKIIQPGTYFVDRKDGSKSRVYISPERIGRMADTFSRMTDNGLKIPAPWRHDPEAKPVRLDMDRQDIDAYQNAGFWNKVWQDEDGSLYGELDVKDRKAASKVGKTVVECSPRLDNKWEDGSGDEYEDALTHIALVTHPVIRDQDNFVPVEEPGMALSLASYVAATDVTALPLNLAMHDSSSIGVDAVSGQSKIGNEGYDTSVQGASADVKTAIQALALMGVIIPDDTQLEKLPERIVVAAQNFVAGKEQSDEVGLGSSSLNKPPKGSKEQRSTIVMSKELEAVIANQDAIREHLSEDGELTLEYLQGLTKPEEPPQAQFSQEQLGMLEHAEKEWRKSYEREILDCVNKGQISPQIVKDIALPLLKSVEFAFGADKQPVRNNLDVALETWKAIPEGSFLTGRSPTTVKQSKVDAFGQTTFSLEGLLEEEGPDGMEEPTQLSKQQSEELADSILEMAGIEHK